MQEYINNFYNYETNVLNHTGIAKLRQYHLNAFHQFLCEERKKSSVEDIELQDVLDFITKIKISQVTKKGNNISVVRSNNTIFQYVVCLRMFFRFLNMIGKKLKINWEQIPIIKCEEKKREMMTEEEYQLYREAPIKYNPCRLEGLRDRLVIDIAWETGLRRAEICRIKFEDFHGDKRQFEILVKGGRQENVFFSESLKEKVLEFERILKTEFPGVKFERPICYVQNKIGVPVDPIQISLNMRRYSKILQEKGLVRKNLSLHQARHAFAMRCVYSGLSQQATTQLMRHRDPKITLQYYHLADNWLLNQYDKIK